MHTFGVCSLRSNVMIVVVITFTGRRRGRPLSLAVLIPSTDQ